MLRRYMESNSWYEDYKKTLNKNDILFSEDEIEKVFNNYMYLINFDKEEYNYDNFRKYKFIEFLDDDYSNECRTDLYISGFLKEFDCLYAIPVVFSYEDLNHIKNENVPPIAIKSCSNNRFLKKCAGSLISYYSGEFVIFSEDFSSFLIAKPGHYFIKSTDKKNYCWDDVLWDKYEFYDYDRNVLLGFAKVFK